MAQGRSTKIITMIAWIRTIRLSIKNSLSLTQVLQEMRRLRSDPKYLEQGSPMGSEVRSLSSPSLSLGLSPCRNVVCCVLCVVRSVLCLVWCV